MRLLIAREICPDLQKVYKSGDLVGKFEVQVSQGAAANGGGDLLHDILVIAAREAPLVISFYSRAIQNAKWYLGHAQINKYAAHDIGKVGRVSLAAPFIIMSQDGTLRQAHGYITLAASSGPYKFSEPFLVKLGMQIEVRQHG